MWDWQSKSHLHEGLSVSARGFFIMIWIILVEDHCSSPYVFFSPTEVTKALALCYPLCVVYESECVLVLFCMICFYSCKYQVEISSVNK
jgi:hypothetical protein